MNRKQGFTLIELLVVIAIIALLLSIVLPALSKVKEQSKSLVCKANLKQITLAAKLWSDDNKGWAVGNWWMADPAETWGLSNYTSLQPYLVADNTTKGKTALVCPSTANIPFPEYTGWAYKACTYGVNGWITEYHGEDTPGDPGDTGSPPYEYLGPGLIYATQHGATKMIKIRQPAQTVFFTDHSYGTANEWTYNPLVPPTRPYLVGDFPTRWHSKKPGDLYGYGNMGWVDGHVSKEPDDLKSQLNKTKSGQRWRYYFYDH